MQRHAFLDFLNKSVMGSMFTRYKTPALVEPRLPRDVHAASCCARTSTSGSTPARQFGVPMPLASLTRDMVQTLIGHGYAPGFRDAAPAAGEGVGDRAGARERPGRRRAFILGGKMEAGRRQFLKGSAALGLAAGGCAPLMPREPADALIVNARVSTMNPRQPEAEALALKGDRILAVGARSEIEAYRGSRYEGHRRRRPPRDPGAERRPYALHPRRPYLYQRGALGRGAVARRRHAPRARAGATHAGRRTGCR